MIAKLKEYAKLLIQSGLNVQKGQTVVISSPVETAYFARLCTSSAYELGAKEVVVQWYDDFINREKYLHASEEVFDEYPNHLVEFNDYYANMGAGFLKIYASDPENLKGVNADRIQRLNKISGEKTEHFRQMQMSNVIPWCVASVPVEAWAKKVFPNDEKAMDKLWDSILATVRVSGNGDAIELWNEHTKKTYLRKEKLNEYNFKQLHYKNSLGTDLVVELPLNHSWEGGTNTNSKGVKFSANMPSEEIFTAPNCNKINGKLVATMPLVMQGNIIDGFSFEIKDGKIISVSAKQGKEILENAISVDEGASYFGEIALVSKNSPIKKQGILFYNTLFDENASCHFAFGKAYPCLKDAKSLTKEELKNRGINDSLTHIDFMVGSDDLSIIGTTHTGEEVAIFIDGDFAF